MNTSQCKTIFLSPSFFLFQSVLLHLDAKSKDVCSLLMELLETTELGKNILNISAYKHGSRRVFLVPLRKQTERTLFPYILVSETVCPNDESSLISIRRTLKRNRLNDFLSCVRFGFVSQIL